MKILALPMDIYFCEYGMIRLLMNLFLELVKKGRRGMKMKLKKKYYTLVYWVEFSFYYLDVIREVVVRI